jgi:hypothetical protein
MKAGHISILPSDAFVMTGKCVYVHFCTRTSRFSVLKGVYSQTAA